MGDDEDKPRRKLRDLQDPFASTHTVNTGTLRDMKPLDLNEGQGTLRDLKPPTGNIPNAVLRGMKPFGANEKENTGNLRDLKSFPQTTYEMTKGQFDKFMTEAEKQGLDTSGIKPKYTNEFNSANSKISFSTDNTQLQKILIGVGAKEQTPIKTPIEPKQQKTGMQ